MPDLAINSYFNFSVYANSVLGTSYRNVKLLSILNYHTALKFANIELLQKQVFPYLPPGTPSDHTQYNYYLFSYKDKDLVLADVWIQQNSIEKTVGLNYNLKLNDVTPTQIATIRDQLRLLGISFDIV